MGRRARHSSLIAALTGNGVLRNRHDHGDHFSAAPTGGQRRLLALALSVTALFLVVEAVGGVLTGSLALLADAGHMLTDVGALGLALFAAWLATRPHSAARSYGYHRAEILATLGNAIALWGIAGYIFVEASARLRDAPAVRSGPMLAIAALALAANLAVARILMRESASLNVRAALTHVAGDALGSIGAILAASLMLAFGWRLADPVISVIIGAFLVATSVRLLWPAIHILLEGTPAGMDLGELERSIQRTEGVLQVHDLHAWTLTSGYNAVTAHVVISDEVPAAGREQVLDRLRHMIPERFPVRHVTIQLEESSHCCDEAHLPGGDATTPAGRSSHGDRRGGGL